MPETNQLIFSYKEVVTALIKDQHIHEGIWGFIVNFGMQAQNVGPNENELRPAVLIPLLSVGLMKFDKETNISVDAAKVNPAPSANTKAKKAPH
jgi:hypothetical protein